MQYIQHIQAAGMLTYLCRCDGYFHLIGELHRYVQWIVTAFNETVSKVIADIKQYLADHFKVPHYLSHPLDM